jgi:PTS system nitrogen regulatory IIA component
MPELLTTKQLAEYLQLSERSIYRLLEHGEIPAVKVGGHWRFRKSVVDEWLDMRIQQLDAVQLEDTFRDDLNAGTPSVGELLSTQNIFLYLPHRTRRDVLGALATLVNLPEEVDRDLLLARLLEREAMCTTALPDGVAVPHTPRPRPRLLAKHDVIALVRTREPIEFGALDGSLTDLFVLVLAREEKAHLVLVARVNRLVREPAVLHVMRTSRSPRQILHVIRQTERRLFDAPATDNPHRNP